MAVGNAGRVRGTGGREEREMDKCRPRYPPSVRRLPCNPGCHSPVKLSFLPVTADSGEVGLLGLAPLGVMPCCGVVRAPLVASARQP